MNTTLHSKQDFGFLLSLVDNLCFVRCFENSACSGVFLLLAEIFLTWLRESFLPNQKPFSPLLASLIFFFVSSLRGLCWYVPLGIILWTNLYERFIKAVVLYHFEFTMLITAQTTPPIIAAIARTKLATAVTKLLLHRTPLYAFAIGSIVLFNVSRVL